MPMEKAYQMNQAPETLPAAAAKLTVVWSGVMAGLANWELSDLAAAAAFVYSCILILEKVGRAIAAPLAHRKGGAK